MSAHQPITETHEPLKEGQERKEQGVLASALLRRVHETLATKGIIECGSELACCISEWSAAQKATADDGEMLDWLEQRTRKSPTGISFDWVPSVEGEPCGFRFMRRHFIGDARKTLRQAIASAMSDNPVAALEKRESQS